MAYKNLLSSFKLGDHVLTNRVALAPMTRARASPEGVPLPIMTTYFAQRADHNLLITDATSISQQGYGWPSAPGIWTDAQVEAWKPVVQAVHERGAVIALQLWHLGRQMHSSTSGLPIVSASEVPLKDQVTTKNGKADPEVPHALTEEEIKQVVEDYGVAADNAIHRAGFDFVELHGANGYLVDQFLQSVSNLRKDKYGGSIENRVRFLDEVTDRILRNIPASKVGVRLSPNGAYGDMGSPDNVETFTEAIKLLARKNVAFIHVMDGLGFGFHNLTKPFTLEDARAVVRSVGGHSAIIGNVGYTAEAAEEQIAGGHADLIAFGRPYISNPDLVARLQRGVPLAPAAEYPTWWKSADGEKNYIDWPTSAAGL